MKKANSSEQSLKEILEQKTSEHLLMESFSIYRLKKENFVKCLVFGILCAILSYIIAASNNTLDVFPDIADCVLGIVLALFGITFTGYTFFQALLNGKMIELLISGRNEKVDKNNFTELNESFVCLMMQYIFIAVISFFLKIFCLNIESGFWLTKYLLINNLLAMFVIFVYLYISVMAIWYIKSFVYNIFQLFNLHAVREYLDMKKEDKEFKDKS